MGILSGEGSLGTVGGEIVFVAPWRCGLDDANFKARPDVHVSTISNCSPQEQLQLFEATCELVVYQTRRSKSQERKTCPSDRRRPPPAAGNNCQKQHAKDRADGSANHGGGICWPTGEGRACVRPRKRIRTRRACRPDIHNLLVRYTEFPPHAPGFHHPPPSVTRHDTRCSL